MNEHDKIKSLANGVKHAIDLMYPKADIEFMLIMVCPIGKGEVTINTITAITDPLQVAQIGQHLVDMAQAQCEADGDLHNQSRTEGHA